MKNYDEVRSQFCIQLIEYNLRKFVAWALEQKCMFFLFDYDFYRK